MKKRVLLSLVLVLSLVMILVGCTAPTYANYTIPMIDLEKGVVRRGEYTRDNSGKDTDTLYEFTKEELANPMFSHKTIVADKDDFGKDYMAHPDSILLREKKDGTDEYVFGSEILTMFPLSHGKGELKAKISYDGGMTYAPKDTLRNTPSSWTKSQETPSLDRLIFNKDNISDENDLLLLTAGNPRWPGQPEFKCNGFNASISAPSYDSERGAWVEGREWSQFETWFGHGQDLGAGAIIREPKGMMKAADPIVAMSSLTRLKKTVTNPDGTTSKVWDNRWMGLYHDHSFNCYKTILSFAEPTAEEKAAGYPTYNVCGTPMVMHWSEPVKYFDAYRKVELKSNMCEVECVRSDAGKGDTLALLTRSNSKKLYSLVTFSEDEGETWSEPRELPQALSGERLKAEWVKDNKGNDKLFVTFRSIERSGDKVGAFAPGSTWMSEGYVAWLGGWDDLVNGTEGDFRVKIAHTYLDGQETESRSANGDTGYCGNVVLAGNKVATCSYGRFSPTSDPIRGGHTYIAGRVLDITELYNYLDKIAPKA